MKNTVFERGPLLAATLGMTLVGFTAIAFAAPHHDEDNSSTVTQDTTTQSSADQVTGLISDRLSDVTGDGAQGGGTASLGITGKAAGSAAATRGLWFNAAVTNVDDDHTGANYDGNIYTFLVGYDATVGDKLRLGLAAGYERVLVDTDYNSGSVQGTAWTLAPYLSYQISDMLSLNATVGRAWASYDLDHAPSAVGSTDGERWFGAANLVAKQTSGQWKFSETLGYFYVTETQDAYTETGGGALAVPESKRHVGQIRVGGKAGYEIPTHFGTVTPYVSARAEFDVAKSSDPILSSGAIVSKDDSGATFGAGVKAAMGENMTLSLEATTTAFRSDYEARGLSATLSFKF